MGFTSKAKRWIKAGTMIRDGRSIHAVSQQTGLSPSTICRMKRDPRTFSPELFGKSNYTGRRPRIDAEAQNHVRLALIAGFSLQEHSLARARKIIKDVSGIEYCDRHIRRLIKTLKAEIPKGAMYGHYNCKKYRCKCGQLLVKRTCLLCLIREIKDADL